MAIRYCQLRPFRDTPERCCFAPLVRAGGEVAAGAGACGRPAPPSVSICSAATPLKPAKGAVRLADVEVNVPPIAEFAEWKQMYHECGQSSCIYSTIRALHGVQCLSPEKEYEKLSRFPRSASDLTTAAHDMNQRHHGWEQFARRRAAHPRGQGPFRADLLRARITRCDGKYRFKQIYTVKAGTASAVTFWPRRAPP